MRFVHLSAVDGDPARLINIDRITHAERLDGNKFRIVSDGDVFVLGETQGKKLWNHMSNNVGTLCL